MDIEIRDTTPRGGGLPKKFCPGCLETKLAEQFHKNNASPDGLFNVCKVCRNSSRREKYASDDNYRANWLNSKNGRYAANDGFRYREVRREKLRTMQRRANKYGCRTYVLPEDPWQVLKDEYGPVCMVPHCTEANVHIDHIVALSKKGDHGIHNMQLLCRSHNSRKGVKNTDYRPYVADFGEQYRQLDSNIAVKGSGSPVDGLLGQDPLQIPTNNTEGLESEIDKETK